MTGRRQRGQSNLLAVAVALVVLTAVTVLGLTVADAAFAGADRPVEDRRVAVALSERLVAADSPVTDRANVLNASAVERLDGSGLRSEFPVVGDRSVRVRVGDRTVAERGDPSGGYQIRRIVLVESRTAVTRTPRLDRVPAVTLPRRTLRVDVRIDPPVGTTVGAVRADGRVVLRNASGLVGNFTVAVSRLETVSLTFDAAGPLPDGAVSVTYYPADTTKAELEVTVGE